MYGQTQREFIGKSVLERLIKASNVIAVAILIILLYNS